MRYEIIFSPEALEDLKQLRPEVRSGIKRAIEIHLRYEPDKVSRSRIKRLRGLLRPEYRLRVGDDIRIFYDVERGSVQVLAIVSKSDAPDWLLEKGQTE